MWPNSTNWHLKERQFETAGHVTQLNKLTIESKTLLPMWESCTCYPIKRIDPWKEEDLRLLDMLPNSTNSPLKGRLGYPCEIAAHFTQLKELTIESKTLLPMWESCTCYPIKRIDPWKKDNLRLLDMLPNSTNSPLKGRLGYPCEIALHISQLNKLTLEMKTIWDCWTCYPIQRIHPWKEDLVTHVR